jgi:hypothetical protein
VVNVVVHFSKVEVHKAGDGEGDQAGWTEIPLNVPNGTFGETTKEVDLNAQMGNVLLAQGQVEAGKYTQIRIYMDEDYVPYPVEVTYEEDGVAKDPVGAKLPSGVIRFVRTFEVLSTADDEGEGKATWIVLDFDLQKSVVFTGASQSEDVKVIVKPVVKLSIEQEWAVGTIDGTVNIDGTVTDSDTGDPIEDATVEVNVEGTILSDTTDETGKYEIDNVLVGTHTVTASAEGYVSASEEVEVNADATSTADFALIRDLKGDWLLTISLDETTFYNHDMVIDTQDPPGTSFSGTGGYPAGADPYGQEWDVEGEVGDGAVSMAITYTDGSGYSVDLTGTVVDEATMEGTWEDSLEPKQMGNWTASRV